MATFQKNNQKGVKKARRPQAKNNQSLQEALKSNANFSQNDIQKINALNAEFQSKLANSTSANKAGISKLKVERLKKAIGEIKYHKLKFLENKQFNINPKNKSFIFSCGTGITASVLALGAELIGMKNYAVYDGSWTEWGSTKDLPIERSDEKHYLE